MEVKHLYEFGPFRLNSEERLLLRGGEHIPLTPKVYDILLVLVRNGGRVVGKEELMKEVWPDSFVEEGNINRNISTLRKALGESPSEARYIQTIPKRGYRFVADVREAQNLVGRLIESESVEEAISDEQKATSQREPAANATLLPEAHPSDSQKERGTRKRLQSVRRPSLIFIVCVLVIGLGIALFYKGPKNEEKAGAVPTVRSIAVLPFMAVKVEPGDEYLALGMTDALITKLSNLRQIAVRPTRAVLKYTDREEDLLTAGRALKVDSVLDGSVQRFGDRVRVTVQLVSVGHEAPLWAETFDEKFTHIFAVQDSISNKVAQALTLRLTGEERQRLAKRYTDNSEAYHLYLKGRYYWNKRTPEALKKAIECFEEAIVEDSNYALAYAGLADCYALGGLSLPPREAMLKAKAAAIKALEIDDALAEAYTSLGFVRYRLDWDWIGAERDFKRAIEINPNYAVAHHWYGVYLRAMGRLDEANAEANLAREIDPLSLVINVELGRASYFARQYDRSIEQLRQTLEIDPDFVQAHLRLGQAYEQKGAEKEALLELQRAVLLSGESPETIAALGHAHAVFGKREAARDALNKLIKLRAQSYVPAYDVAILCAGLGEKEQAFAWLQRAVEDRSVSLIGLRFEPMLDDLRSDARFAVLMDRIGLPLPRAGK